MNEKREREKNLSSACHTTKDGGAEYNRQRGILCSNIPQAVVKASRGMFFAIQAAKNRGIECERFFSTQKSIVHLAFEEIFRFLIFRSMTLYTAVIEIERCIV